MKSEKWEAGFKRHQEALEKYFRAHEESLSQMTFRDASTELLSVSAPSGHEEAFRPRPPGAQPLTHQQLVETVESLLPGTGRFNPKHIALLAALAIVDEVVSEFLGSIEEKNKDVWSRVERRTVAAADFKTPEELGAKLNDVFKGHVAENGTVLLVAGSSWASRILRVATNSRFSHVALIVPCVSPGPMAFQATQTSPSKANFPPANIPAGSMTNDGTSMHDLARYILAYLEEHPGTRFVLRKVKHPLTQQQVRDLNGVLVSAVGKADRYPELNKLALAWAADQSPLLHSAITNLFGAQAIAYKGKVCSELVAAALDTARVLTLDKPADLWYPHDFSLDAGHPNPIRLGSNPPDTLFEDHEVEIVVEHTSKNHH